MIFTFRNLFLIGLLTSMANSSFSQSQENCLILDLPFHSTINDQGPNNFSTVSSSSIEYTTDRFGNENSALNFDGISDQIILNDNNAVVTGTIVSISLWAKANGDAGGGGRNCIFQQRGNSTSNPNIIGIMYNTTTTSQNTIFSANSTAVSAQKLIEVQAAGYGDWHHYVLVITSDSLIGYRDGQKFGSTQMPSGGTYSTVDYVTLGTHTYLGAIRGYFNGDLDDFQIYDCDLSAAQVLDLYEAEEPNNISEVPEDLQNPKIYPNPTSDIINITWPSSSKDLLNYTIYNMTGEMVSNIQNQKQINQTIDLSALPSGMYILKINGLNTNHTSSIIKNDL